MERRAAQSRFDQAKGFVADFAFGNVRIDSLESKPKRGQNTLAMRGALGVALLVAACGGDKAPATQTPVLPTEQPTPSIMVNPTPEVTPSPTPEVTPSPTPEVTPSPTPEATQSPYTLKSIIESKPKAISASTVEAAIKTAWNTNKSIHDAQPLSYYIDKWNTCKSTGTVTADREVACLGLIHVIAVTDNDPQNLDKNTYDAAKDVFYYAETHLPAETAKDIITKLEQFI